jgi:hypothetical protein
MTLAAYVRGVVLLVAALGPLIAGGRRLRARLVPAWDGAVARLAEAVLVTALLVVVLEVDGSVGGFRTGLVVISCLVAGTVAAVLGRTPKRSVPAPSDRRLRVPIETLAAAVAVAVVVGQWMSHAATTLNGGVVDSDSLTYHLPFAARFVQTGWVTHLHHTSPEFPWTFHPASSELLHGLGILAFHRDILSPWLNLVWLAVAFLAAWCVGAPSGRGPLTLLGCAVVLGSPLLAYSQAGSAENDIVVIALFLAAIALLRQENRGRNEILLAGLAAGLAVGAKLTVLAPVALLTIVLVVAARRGSRLVTTAHWCIGLVATGAFWYLRNWVRAGSPIPSIHLGVGRLAFPSPHFLLVNRYSPSVAHYLTNRRVWDHWFRPGLRIAFGSVWWLVLAVALIGMVAAVTRGSSAPLRGFGIVGLGGVLAYLVTPATAAGFNRGQPIFFTSDLRYVTPIVALGLVLVPLLGAGNRRYRIGLLVLFLGLLAADQSAPNAWVSGRLGLGIGAAVAVLVAVAAVVSLRRIELQPGTFALGSACVAVVVLVAGFGVQHRYLANRDQGDAVAAWASRQHRVRIGVVGNSHQYRLYGNDLTNFVQYVGTVDNRKGFHQVRTCPEWWRAVQAGRYQYLVIDPQDTYSGNPTLPLIWSSRAPGVRQIATSGTVHLFRVSGAGLQTCA